MRILARFLEQLHQGIPHLQALAFDLAAFKSYAGIAMSGKLEKNQLATLRKEILSTPLLSDDDPIRDQIEEMSALDEIMVSIRGDAAVTMRIMAFDFSKSAPINLGDWPNADWDVALKETRRLSSLQLINPKDSFSAKLTELTKKVEADRADKVPQTLDSLDDISALLPQIEAFLKMKPGETREAFTQRVTSWLQGGSPADQRRFIFLEEPRPRHAGPCSF